jgi:hypothetical protein
MGIGIELVYNIKDGYNIFETLKEEKHYDTQSNKKLDSIKKMLFFIKKEYIGVTYKNPLVYIKILKKICKDECVVSKSHDGIIFKKSDNIGARYVNYKILLWVLLKYSKNMKWLSKKSNFLLRKTSKYGLKNIVKILLKNEYVTLGDYDNYAFRWACRNGHEYIVKMLAEDPRFTFANDLQEYAFRWACRNGHSKIVNFLLSNFDIDVNICNYDALIKSLNKGYYDNYTITNLIIDYNMITDEYVKILVHFGNLRLFKKIIKNKNLNFKKKDHYLFRYICKKSHYLEMIEYTIHVLKDVIDIDRIVDVVENKIIKNDYYRAVLLHKFL